MRSPTTYGLAVLLLASLAFNVRLWTARDGPRDDRARVPTGTALVALPRVDSTPCERRLQACEQRSWEIARQVIAADRAPGSTGSTDGAARGSEHPAQTAALCAKAEQNLRETWQRDRDKIAWSLAQSLADKDEQERNVVKEAARMRDVAGLDDREAAEVARAYREKRLARVADAQVTLGREPQDFIPDERDLRDPGRDLVRVGPTAEVRVHALCPGGHGPVGHDAAAALAEVGEEHVDPAGDPGTAGSGVELEERAPEEGDTIPCAGGGLMFLRAITNNNDGGCNNPTFWIAPMHVEAALY
jgi:hypothetical protein